MVRRRLHADNVGDIASILALACSDSPRRYTGRSNIAEGAKKSPTRTVSSSSVSHSSMEVQLSPTATSTTIHSAQVTSKSHREDHGTSQSCFLLLLKPCRWCTRSKPSHKGRKDIISRLGNICRYSFLPHRMWMWMGRGECDQSRIALIAPG